jgi:hypothetical protein
LEIVVFVSGPCWKASVALCFFQKAGFFYSRYKKNHKHCSTQNCGIMRMCDTARALSPALTIDAQKVQSRKFIVGPVIERRMINRNASNLK